MREIINKIGERFSNSDSQNSMRENRENRSVRPTAWNISPDTKLRIRTQKINKIDKKMASRTNRNSQLIDSQVNNNVENGRKPL